MSQVTLDNDLNIIGNSDLEITLLDGDLNIIQKLDDEPNDVGGLTAAELKAKFDESGLTIQKYINETLIPELIAADAVEIARIRAENQRTVNEELRIENERVRNTAEKQRENTTSGIVAQATAQAKEAKKQADRAEAAASGGNHASRHGKNGSDPITPAAIGAVPLGFGYGEVVRLRTTIDTDGTVFEAMLDEQLAKMANGETRQFWFADYPILTGYDGLLTLHKRNEDCALAVAHFSIPEGNVQTAHKAYFNRWFPWSLENPILDLGGVDSEDKQFNEYRTTQMYRGAVIYEKLINLGQAPLAGSSVQYVHKIANIRDCISMDVSLFNATWSKTLLSSNSVNNIAFTTSYCLVSLADGAGDLSNYELLARLKYTKTTD